MENVGFVGLGNMGEPMARRLLSAGHNLAIWNRTPGRAEALRDEGALFCEWPGEVALCSNVVFTMLSDDAAVGEVLFGRHGVLEGARREAVVVEMSTISPIAARSFAARFAADGRGIEMLDAPVSGGVIGARDGILTIMVGGNAGTLERVRPLLSCLGTRIVRIGDHGAGQVAKAANQLMVSLHIIAAAEALTFAKTLGVDPAAVREALLGGFAASRVLEVHGERMLHERFDPGFTARLHAKDLRIVEEAARSAGLILPGTDLAGRLLAELVASGGAELDSSALITRIVRSAATVPQS